MVAIDFKKAFDSVQRNFMLEMVSAFNFGPTFIHWMRWCPMESIYLSKQTYFNDGRIRVN